MKKIKFVIKNYRASNSFVIQGLKQGICVGEVAGSGVDNNENEKSPKLTNNLPECKVVDETYFYKKTNGRSNGAYVVENFAGKTKTESMENSVKVHKSVIADKKVKIEKFPVKPDDLNCMFK